jgi:ribosome-associated protein
LDRLASKIDRQGILRVVAAESRSQWQNKQWAIEKFVSLLQQALKPKKKRVPTKPSVASKQRRLNSKKLRGETKKSRKVNLE